MLVQVPTKVHNYFTGLNKILGIFLKRKSNISLVEIPAVATPTDLRLSHKLFHLARTSLMNNKTLRVGDLDCNKIFAVAHANPPPLLTDTI